MSITHYDSYTDARAHLTDLLDAAERGRVASWMLPIIGTTGDWCS